MRFLVRFTPVSEDRSHELSLVRGIAKAFGVDPRSPKWTSRGALELDLYAPARGDVDLFLAAAEPVAETEFVRDLNEPPPYKPEREMLEEAVALFNEERYWESHEVLEGLWRVKDGEEKRTLQGVILVCAALVHHQKGEETVALGVLRQAARVLEGAGGEYGTLDIRKLKAQASLALERGSIEVFTI